MLLRAKSFTVALSFLYLWIFCCECDFLAMSADYELRGTVSLENRNTYILATVTVPLSPRKKSPGSLETTKVVSTKKHPAFRFTENYYEKNTIFTEASL